MAQRRSAPGPTPDGGAPGLRSERDGAEPAAGGSAGRVVLGRIVGAHGVRGQVRVRFFGDGPDNLLHLEAVWLGGDGGPAERREVAFVGSGRGGEVRMALVGVADREAAAALRGRLVEVPTEWLETLPEGEFYWHQLIGCRVWGEDGTDVGVVRGLLETGAHDVLVVEDDAGRRHLIPAAAALLREIDLDARRIVVELVPGLVEPS